MSVHQRAQRVYVHFTDRFGYCLFGLHVRRVLPGFPIPACYTVHETLDDATQKSVNLVMTNGGGPVDNLALAEYINSFKIFGQVEVGVYGTQELFS